MLFGGNFTKLQKSDKAQENLGYYLLAQQKVENQGSRLSDFVNEDLLAYLAVTKDANVMAETLEMLPMLYRNNRFFQSLVDNVLDSDQANTRAGLHLNALRQLSIESDDLRVTESGELQNVHFSIYKLNQIEHSMSKTKSEIEVYSKYPQLANDLVKAKENLQSEEKLYAHYKNMLGDSKANDMLKKAFEAYKKDGSTKNGARAYCMDKRYGFMEFVGSNILSVIELEDGVEAEYLHARCFEASMPFDCFGVLNEYKLIAQDAPKDLLAPIIAEGKQIMADFESQDCSGME